MKSKLEQTKNLLESTLREDIGENVDVSEYSDLQEKIKPKGYWKFWENVKNELENMLNEYLGGENE